MDSVLGAWQIPAKLKHYGLPGAPAFAIPLRTHWRRC